MDVLHINSLILILPKYDNPLPFDAIVIPARLAVPEASVAAAVLLTCNVLSVPLNKARSMKNESTGATMLLHRMFPHIVIFFHLLSDIEK